MAISDVGSGTPAIVLVGFVRIDTTPVALALEAWLADSTAESMLARLPHDWMKSAIVIGVLVAESTPTGMDVRATDASEFDEDDEIGYQLE